MRAKISMRTKHRKTFSSYFFPSSFSSRCLFFSLRLFFSSIALDTSLALFVAIHRYSSLFVAFRRSDIHFHFPIFFSRSVQPRNTRSVSFTVSESLSSRATLTKATNIVLEASFICLCMIEQRWLGGVISKVTLRFGLALALSWKRKRRIGTRYRIRWENAYEIQHR